MFPSEYRRREDTTENELSAVFIPLMTSQSASNIPSERRKKIKERLRQFLRRRPTLESLREKGIFKGFIFVVFKIDSGIESKIDSGIESKIDSGIESKIDSGIESKIDSGIESKID